MHCGWSPWLNGDRPNFGTGDNGDLETIAALKTKFGLCKSIVDIKCRVANTNTAVGAAGQNGVLCDAVNGLRCYNKYILQSNSKMIAATVVIFLN